MIARRSRIVLEGMIQLDHLTKTFGAKTAVDDITVTIQPGKVTGFLGPNGAGKSTTMRMIIGLDRPTHGTALVNGKRYAEHRSPLPEVGALLDAKAVHTGRTAYNHLLAMAATHGIPQAPRARGHRADRPRVRREQARRRLLARHGPAARYRRGACSATRPRSSSTSRSTASTPRACSGCASSPATSPREGRTVFLSSHLMSEMAQTADHIIVLGRGRILADAPVDDILAGATRNAVRVRTPQPEQLAQRSSPART